MTRGGGPAETIPKRAWWMLALVCLCQLFGMTPWFTASAIGRALPFAADLDAAQLGWLTSAVQLGFVAGTLLAVALNLADVLPARVYVALACALAGAANATLLVAPDLTRASVARFATGAFLAGVYPPAMKMVATWFRWRRGLAVGAVVGALILGKAFPYLLKVAFPHDAGAVILAASVFPLAAAWLIGVFYRDGPYAFQRPRFSWSRAREVLAHRPTRLAIGGYVGHMWELYAVWAWLPAFFAAALAGRPNDARTADLLSWLTIAAGAAGSVAGGWVADRWGRDRWVNLCMAVSGACCLLAGLLFGAGPWALLGLGLVWGFFVVADSAQFSTMVTESAPAQSVGTALTLQTAIGFLVTMVTVQGVGALADGWGWRWAFPVLAAGPAFGIACILRWHPTARSRGEALRA